MRMDLIGLLKHSVVLPDQCYLNRCAEILTFKDETAKI